MYLLGLGNGGFNCPRSAHTLNHSPDSTRLSSSELKGTASTRLAVSTLNIQSLLIEETLPMRDPQRAVSECPGGSADRNLTFFCPATLSKTAMRDKTKLTATTFTKTFDSHVWVPMFLTHV